MNRIRVSILIAVVGAALAVTFALTYAQTPQSPITFTLDGMNDSGQSGVVTLTDAGSGKTLVEITVDGQPAGSSQPVQVHEGRCGPTLARIVYNLEDLQDGKSTTTINIGLAALASEGSQYAINSHKSQAEYNIYVLCGNIPTQAQAVAFAAATEVSLRAMQTRPPGGIAPVTFALVEENDSGQNGTVTLTDLGNGKTMVEVVVTGEPDGASQPLHVHEGQCGPTLARLAYNLNNLEAGKSSTTIDASLDMLISEGFRFAVNSHKSQKEYNIYVLCGNVPVAGQAQPTAIISAATPEAAPTQATAASQAPATTVPPTAPPPTVAATTAPPAATATAVPPTAAPATNTAIPPTAVPPTATTVPATAVPPTATSLPPTATRVPATATSVPTTAVPPTATRVPATATPIPATAVPDTATSVPATATRVPATATSAPATAVPATATNAPATTAAVSTTTGTNASQAETTTPPATAAGATTQAASTTQAEPTGDATETTQAEPTAETTVTAQAESTADATETAQAEPTGEATAEPTTPTSMPQTGADMSADGYLGIGAIGVLALGAGLGLMRMGRPAAKKVLRSRTNRKKKKTARR
jgi:hypothetical protein